MYVRDVEAVQLQYSHHTKLFLTVYITYNKDTSIQTIINELKTVRSSWTHDVATTDNSLGCIQSQY